MSEIFDPQATYGPQYLAAIGKLPSSVAWQNDAAPLSYDNGILLIGLAKENEATVRLIESQARTTVQVKILEITTIRDILGRAYHANRAATTTSESNVQKLVSAMVAEGVRLGAQDMFVEPRGNEGNGAVRFAVDGIMRWSSEIPMIPRELFERTVNYIREQSKVTNANPGMPADGKFAINVEGRDVELRLGTMPVNVGRSAEPMQRLCLRFVASEIALRSVSELGMNEATYKKLLAAVNRPNAFISLVGMTGEGKSTTAASILTAMVDLDRRNVISIEQPVEVNIVGISQTQVYPDEEQNRMTFADALRGALRMYPQLIFLGELRDETSAKIAFSAASTGISFLTTVHGRDALASLDRYEELGATPKQLARLLSMSVAQRLVRRLCVHCRIKVGTMSETSQVLARAYRVSVKLDNVYEADERGCTECQGEGYRGRIGCFEVLEFSAEVAEAVERGMTLVETAHLATSSNVYRPMAVAALEHFAAGLTSEKEIHSRINFKEAIKYTNTSLRQALVGERRAARESVS